MASGGCADGLQELLSDQPKAMARLARKIRNRGPEVSILWVTGGTLPIASSALMPFRVTYQSLVSNS
jgi:hypothetical protein